MKTELKSLALIAAFAATLSSGFAQDTTIAFEHRDDKPDEPGASNFTHPTPPKNSRNTVVAQNNKRPRELRAYSATGVTFNDKIQKALIIRSSKVEPKANDQLQEDMAVMYRIIEKSIGKHSQDDKVMKMGIPLMTFPGMGARSMYLEDYGVIFTCTVDMPLVPEPAMEKKVADDSEEANEEWDEAKNDLFGKRRAFKGERRGGRPYDADEVNELKEGVIEALRNASNIRNLKPSDWISVVIRGKRMDALTWPVEGGDRFRFEINENVIMNDDGAPESTMVFRIKKSDVDDFAKRKGEKGSLKDKVSITVY